MISIRFGLSLGRPGAAHLPANLGDLDLGPASLIDWLETHLGLGAIHPGSTERSMLYHTALKSRLGQQPFYAASFSADAIGTSAELLRWRDSLYLAGWNGQKHPEFKGRLRDLADVEAALMSDAKCSPGERLNAIHAALGRRRVPLKLIRLLEPRQMLPVAWRRVIDLLPAVEEPSRATLGGSSTLCRLQQGLTQLISGGKPESVAWVNDGSLRVVRGETSLTAARWAAETLRKGGPRTQLVLAAERGEVFDHVVEEAGLPRHGFAETSPFRPSLQVLPLALALTWDPLDVYAALEFLGHSVCPIPRFARETLADRLAERPGLRREDYDDLIQEIRAHYGDAGDEMVRRVDSWLFQPRHSAQDGAPIEAVCNRIDQLRLLLARRAANADDESRIALQAATHQCADAGRALTLLAASGSSRIGPIALRKIVAQATTAGSVNPLRYPQLGCAAYARAPGEVVDPYDRVLWWHMSAPGGLRALPWTRSEVGQLMQVGVEIPTADARQALETQVWLRPIFAARDQLILMLAPESQEAHPVLQLIHAVLRDIPIGPIERVIREEQSDLSCELLPHQALRSRKRWWTLPAGAVQGRPPRNSFTSLDQYINNPFQWVLGYVARLNPSRVRSIPDEFTLSGTVAHRVIELLFQNPSALSMPKAELLAWTESTLNNVIRSEAAVFLLPGRRAAEMRLRTAVLSAITDLCERIRQAGAIRVETERYMEGTFKDLPLVGSADLVLTFKNGEHAVIDVKWAGVRKYPDKLTSNRHLQLLIYGGLLQQATKKWPRYAYYLFKDRRLLAHDRSLFESAHVCAPREAQTLTQLWKRLESTWAWRTSQLEEGFVEVVMDDIDSDERSRAPDGLLELEILSKDYNPFVNLIGWSR